MMPSDGSLRAIAQRRVAERRGFWLDLILYIVINAVIWIAWFAAWPADYGDFPWPIFVTGGWGIGLLAHGLLTYWSLSGADDEAIEREMRKLRDSASRAGR